MEGLWSDRPSGRLIVTDDEAAHCRLLLAAGVAALDVNDRTVLRHLDDPQACAGLFAMRIPLLLEVRRLEVALADANVWQLA